MQPNLDFCFFQTSVISNNQICKYQRVLPSGCKDIGIRNLEFVAKTQFLYQQLEEKNLKVIDFQNVFSKFSKSNHNKSKIMLNWNVLNILSNSSCKKILISIIIRFLNQNLISVQRLLILGGGPTPH